MYVLFKFWISDFLQHFIMWWQQNIYIFYLYISLCIFKTSTIQKKKSDCQTKKAPTKPESICMHHLHNKFQKKAVYSLFQDSGWSNANNYFMPP